MGSSRWLRLVVVWFTVNFLHSQNRHIATHSRARLLLLLLKSIMSFEIENKTTSMPPQRQVRLKLTTRDTEIALPENTGPILVPTGITHTRSIQMSSSHWTDCLLFRSQEVRAFDSGK